MARHAESNRSGTGWPNALVGVLGLSLGLMLVGARAVCGADRAPVNASRPVPAATANEKSAAPVVDPAARSDRPVTAEEKIKFEQDKAHAHMRELEGRMFRVAELLRPTQPDDSARLLMGVTRSREQLIVEEMREASELIAHARSQ